MYFVNNNTKAKLQKWDHESGMQSEAHKMLKHGMKASEKY